MTARPTAEIIADLRAVAGRGPHSLAAWSGLLEAAGRLAELDALRPPCPTCGGKQLVDPRTTEGIGLDHCPDCVDGKVSIERLVAVLNRVFEFGPTAQHTHGGEYGDGWRACIDHLRGVR